MKTKVISIGNSKGFRIPKTLLIQTGITNEVDLSVDGNKLVIAPSKTAVIKSLFNDEYLAAMPALRKDWDRPEEDEAWAFLQ